MLPSLSISTLAAFLLSYPPLASLAINRHAHPGVEIGVAIYLQNSTLFLNFLLRRRIGSLLPLNPHNMSRQCVEDLFDSDAGLGTRTNVYATHLFRVSAVLSQKSYFSASSRVTVRLRMSHLLPATTIGVSYSRYFFSSLIHMPTFLKLS